ncbi:MAG: ribosome biogenesis GTPase Der [Deltaproteobacteria bacterium RBG_13_52_11]|nr:MAG: ribosome biogenesis GTPase Der [Deltaproteobacteria bacterium RBG_13_52_11]
MRPIVAIVGRPNVGKSTLFNRLVGFRKAIVESIPGVTRDRNYAEVNRFERPFTLIDTGGFEPISQDGLLAQMAEQCRLAVEEADVIIFLLDGKEGLNPSDHEIAHLLRRRAKKVLYVINKIDGPKHEERIYDFYALGVETLYPLSAQHNYGIDRLIEAVIDLLASPASEERREHGAIRIAVVGRPNAGKSSLINRILGYDRVIVHETPGTTRDAIDTPFSVGERSYVLVDTAGIRRKARISLRLEKYSVVEAIKSIERADVALLVLDAQEGAPEQDARIGGLIHDKGKGGIIVVNKWDLVGGEAATTAYTEKVRESLWFLDYAPLIFTSAVTGEGVDRIFEVVEGVAAERGNRIPTPRLNRWLQEVVESHAPPLYRKKRVKLSYITQVSTRPPTFAIFTNYPSGVKFSYRRYLNNRLREAFGFFGNPIRLIFRKK